MQPGRRIAFPCTIGLLPESRAPLCSGFRGGRRRPTHPCRARRGFWREIHMSVSAVGPLRQRPASQWRPPNPSSLRRLLPNFSPPPFPLHAFTSTTNSSRSAAARRSGRRERTQCRRNRTASKVRAPSAQSKLLIRPPRPRAGDSSPRFRPSFGRSYR
jgi:hypothetical protein